MQHQIVFLDRATIPQSVQLRRPSFEHAWIEHDRTAAGETAARLRGATIAITNKVRIGAAEMDAAPLLRLIAVAATGTDNIDKDEARARGIDVRNVAGYAAATVPEHVFALILGLRRSLCNYREAVRDGAWQKGGLFSWVGFPITDLADTRLGIVGTGAIGNGVARIAAGFGMQVLIAERPGATATREGRLSFEQVLTSADILTLHCPLTPETRHLLNCDSLARMKRGAIVINTARGPLIDELALEAALESGHLGGAGLDVTMPEPPPEDAPILRLAQRENVIVTPHVGWAGAAAMQTLADQLTGNIERFVAGGSAA